MKRPPRPWIRLRKKQSVRIAVPRRWLQNRGFSRSAVFRLVLPSNRRAGSRARQGVRQRFSETLPGATLGDLFLVVTELVNNSVQHGPGKPITLTLAMSGGSISGEVADQGNPALAIPEIKEATATGGRGLAVVDKLTAQWGVYEESTNVWFEMLMDPRAAHVV